MANIHLLTHFNVARDWIEQSDYKAEVEYYRKLRSEHITREIFFNEYRHVVYAYGYADRNLRALAPRLTKAFRDYDIEAIAVAQSQVRSAALRVFNHEAKVRDVVSMAAYLAHNDWGKFNVRLTGISHLSEIAALDRIGNVTKFHLARISPSIMEARSIDASHS